MFEFGGRGGADGGVRFVHEIGGMAFVNDEEFEDEIAAEICDCERTSYVGCGAFSAIDIASGAELIVAFFTPAA